MLLELFVNWCLLQHTQGPFIVEAVLGNSDAGNIRLMHALWPRGPIMTFVHVAFLLSSKWGKKTLIELAFFVSILATVVWKNTSDRQIYEYWFGQRVKNLFLFRTSVGEGGNRTGSHSVRWKVQYEAKEEREKGEGKEKGKTRPVLCPIWPPRPKEKKATRTFFSDFNGLDQQTSLSFPSITSEEEGGKWGEWVRKIRVFFG